MRHLLSYSLTCSIFRKICCKPNTPASNEEKPQQVKYIPSSFTWLFFTQLIMIIKLLDVCGKQCLGDDFFSKAVWSWRSATLRQLRAKSKLHLQLFRRALQRLNHSRHLQQRTKTFRIKADLWRAHNASCREVCTRQMQIHQCTPTLCMKLHTSSNTAVNESWWNPFKRTSTNV